MSCSSKIIGHRQCPNILKPFNIFCVLSHQNFKSNRPQCPKSSRPYDIFCALPHLNMIGHMQFLSISKLIFVSWKDTYQSKYLEHKEIYSSYQLINIDGAKDSDKVTSNLICLISFCPATSKVIIHRNVLTFHNFIINTVYICVLPHQKLSATNSILTLQDLLYFSAISKMIGYRWCPNISYKAFVYCHR